jgi:hypothetical protein
VGKQELDLDLEEVSGKVAGDVEKRERSNEDQVRALQRPLGSPEQSVAEAAARRGRTAMRVMVMIKGRGVDEERIGPTTEMFEEMGRYNEELVKAGIMLGGDGLRPTSAGAKVVFAAGGETSVVDGPFTESKEIVAGYWVWQVSSMEEAVEWAKRCPQDAYYGAEQVLEVRPFVEPEDLADQMTPELRAKEADLARRIREQQQGA